MTSTLTERPEPTTNATTESLPRVSASEGLGSVRVAVAGVLILAAAVFAFGGLRAGRDTGPTADQDISALAVLAGDLVTTAKANGGALDAIGGYLPGTGIVLTLQLPDLEGDSRQTWVQEHLDPFAEQLSVLPDGESVVITVTELNSTDARIWSLSPDAISRRDGAWNQLVAPATFVDSGNAAVVAAQPADTELEAGAESDEEAAAPESGETEAGAADAEPAEETQEALETEPAAEPEPAQEPEPAAEPEPVEEAEPAPTNETAPEPDPQPAPPDPEPAPPDVEAVVTGSNDGGSHGWSATDRIAGFEGDWYSDVDIEGPFARGSNWNPVFGSWVLNDGIYSQSDATGFGYAAEFAGATPAEYDVSVVMRAQYGDMNGGIIYGLPDTGTKAHGKVVDFTDSGGYLRWGEYDENGDWAFIGGAPIDPPLEQLEWNKLTLQIRADGTSVVLNDEFIATIDPVDPHLGVALVASVAALDFKNFDIIDVNPDAAAGIQTSADDSSGGGEPEVIVFEDDLADWSLLSGSWIASDGVMRQTNGQAYDQMVHFSGYRQDNYRVQVDIRALPESDFSGGLLFNISTFGDRSNSQIFDIVDDGTVVRWAGYDQNGVFNYVGGVRVEGNFDPDAWHTIAVEVRDDRAEFIINGTVVGASPNVGSAGYVGLVTSLAAMEFRNFVVTDLD